MPPAEFEPTISAGERPQTYALDRAATTTGVYIYGSHFDMKFSDFIVGILIIGTFEG